MGAFHQKSPFDPDVDRWFVAAKGWLALLMHPVAEAAFEIALAEILPFKFFNRSGSRMGL
jgi:hypothetical protein